MSVPRLLPVLMGCLSSSPDNHANFHSCLGFLLLCNVKSLGRHSLRGFLHYSLTFRGIDNMQALSSAQSLLIL